jgi:cyclophilin family peptidyl-prolyl cis-trans isomerase
MRHMIAAAAMATMAAGLCLSATAIAQTANPQVEFKTSAGNITVELFRDKAPKTVANFLQYVNEGYYKGTIFHRVIPGFMVQGGGFERGMREKTPHAPIDNEAGNGLKNDTGTLAMARTSAPHSASAQFFINVANNDALNFREPTPSGYGYAVFGKVTRGMDVVNKIVSVPTGNAGPHQNVPLTPIIIEDAAVVKASAAPASKDAASKNYPATK